MIRSLVLFVALALLPALPSLAETEPLVIVVHGIGGGNRPDGWSDDIAKAWKVPVTEVTFRMDDRTNASSLTDFARQAGDWALSVQRQIRDAVRANPGRRVVIVSHSWGTVATKIALDGGTGGGNSTELVGNSYGVPPINLDGVQVEEWVTLGSPLGRAEDAAVAGNLRQLNVDVPIGRPKAVKHWTNLYDENDPVSRQSHQLDGAENIAVRGSGHWWDVTDMSAHTGIWTNRKVISHVRTKQEEIAALPPLARPKNPDAPTDPEGVRYQRLADALVKLNELECQKRMADPAYGGCAYKIEYTHVPTARQRDGIWHIVGAWRLMEKRPDRDSYFCTFERGDAENPQWISVHEVDAWVSRAGLKWK